MKIKKFKNIEDIKIETETFPHSNKILLITGLSGSGKSYLSKELSQKYNAISFQVEWLIHSKHISEECKEILTNFLNLYPEIIPYVENKWNNCKEEDKNQLLKKYINLFFEYFLKSKDDSKIYIIEGIQLFSLIDYELIKNFPIIIKGTSSFNSLKNRIKRDLLKRNKKDRPKYFFKILKQSKIYQFKHRKKLNAFINKRLINN